MRLPPRGVVRFLRHVLKLEFWHFAHPELNLHCVFASAFAVFFSRRATLYKKMLSSPFRILFFVFSCVCVCVAFRIGVYGVFADSRLFAHASLDLHLSFSSVQGWGGDGGKNREKDGSEVWLWGLCGVCSGGCIIPCSSPHSRSYLVLCFVFIIILTLSIIIVLSHSFVSSFTTSSTSPPSSFSITISI